MRKIIAITLCLLFLMTSGCFGRSSTDVIFKAKDLLSKQLKDPSSASFNDAKVLERDNYDRYLVYLDVTATNGFGGRNRGQYYVILRDELGDKYSYQNNVSFIEAKEINLSWFKSLNKWETIPD